MNRKTTDKIEKLDTSQIEVSSRRRRLFAYIFDSIILSLCMQILFVLFSILSSKNGQKPSLHFSIFSIIVSLSYFSIFPASSWWATPGQKLMGIYICKTTDFSRISLPMSFLRVITFNCLWVISFVIATLVLVGTDIKDLKTVIQKGGQHKKSIHFEGNKFYKDNPLFISLNDKKNNKTIHLLNSFGKSNFIIEDQKHKLSLVNDGTNVGQQYYDHNISFNKEIQNAKTVKHSKKPINESTGEFLFFLLLKLMSYSVIIFLALLIFPTMFNDKKQTLYDLLCKVFVARKN